MRVWLAIAALAPGIGFALAASAARETPLTRLRERQRELYSKPFYAVASVTTRRGRADSELLVRFHFREAGLALVKVEGPPRQHGNVVLTIGRRVHYYFSKADMILTLPSEGLGSTRLFGTDFGPADFSALGCDFEQCEPAGDGVVAGSLTKYTLTFKGAPRDREWDSVELWISAKDGVLVKSEYRSDRRRLWRVLDFEPAEVGRLPATIHVKTFSLDGSAPPSESTLTLRFFEANPHIEESLFRLENLKLWR